MHFYSYVFSGDRAACRRLLKEGLEEYARVIDNRSGINNYAGYINALCCKSTRPITGIQSQLPIHISWRSHCHQMNISAECAKWKSSVLTPDKIKAVVKVLNLDTRTIDEQRADESTIQNLMAKMKVSRS